MARTYVFLTGSRFAHYHLAGSGRVHNVPGANNLLLHVAALESARRGCRRLHLGGGSSSKAEDRLLRFKTSMGTETHEYFIGKRVHLEPQYRRVVTSWANAHPKAAELYSNRVLRYRSLGLDRP